MINEMVEVLYMYRYELLITIISFGASRAVFTKFTLIRE